MSESNRSLPIRWQNVFYSIGTGFLVSQGAAQWLGRPVDRDLLSAGLMIFGLPKAVELASLLGGKFSSSAPPPSPEPPSSSQDSSPS